MSDPQDSSSSSSSSNPASEPLFGATPSETVPTPAAPSPSGAEAPPQVAHAKWANEPLFGAPVAALPARVMSTGNDSWTRTTLASPSRGRPGIYRYLKTLSYVLALTLGASSVFAGIWSIFILPLLHSSFAARKAITEQQLVNMTAFSKSLKALRAISIYPKDAPTPKKDTDLKQVSGGQITAILPATSLSLTSSLSSLPTALRVLTDAFTATDTTRTSLMTSLSTYTNELHAETLRGVKVGGFGLNTALANEGVGGGRGEEWDKTRKEVRLIKGMLLNRRAFTSS